MKIKLIAEINGVQYDLSEDTEFVISTNKKVTEFVIKYNGYTCVYSLSDKNIIGKPKTEEKLRSKNCGLGLKRIVEEERRRNKKSNNTKI